MDEILTTTLNNLQVCERKLISSIFIKEISDEDKSYIKSMLSQSKIYSSFLIALVAGYKNEQGIEGNIRVSVEKINEFCKIITDINLDDYA